MTTDEFFAQLHANKVAAEEAQRDRTRATKATTGNWSQQNSARTYDIPTQGPDRTGVTNQLIASGYPDSNIIQGMNLAEQVHFPSPGVYRDIAARQQFLDYLRRAREADLAAKELEVEKSKLALRQAAKKPPKSARVVGSKPNATPRSNKKSPYDKRQELLDSRVAMQEKLRFEKQMAEQEARLKLALLQRLAGLQGGGINKQTRTTTRDDYYNNAGLEMKRPYRETVTTQGSLVDLLNSLGLG